MADVPAVRLNNGVEMPQMSNFQPWHLQPVLDRGGIVPAVNQAELHLDGSEEAGADKNCPFR